MHTYPTLTLKAGHDHRIQHGHLWIFSNEINTALSPLKTFMPGQLVSIVTASQQFIGIGYINPNCLLCARLLTRESTTIDEAFFVKRISTALQLREKLYAEPYYRLVFADSDLLPGLIIDRYDQTVVLQCNTAGMDRLQSLILAAVKMVLAPERIVIRNDSTYRQTEGLPLLQEVILGSADTPLQVKENGALFSIPLIHGQKTGWFYDHRDNRTQLLPLVKNRKVLDVFSYLGGWAIAAAIAGASEVTCIDSSAMAIDILQKNAQYNQVANRIKTLCANAFDAMTALVQQKQQFDVVIIDPPAFIKSKKDKPAGIHAYLKLNRLALQLLSPGGFLVSASCSMHLHSEDLLTILQQATYKTQSTVSILAQWHQSLDHPIHPMIAETHYLKALLCYKS